MSYNPTLQYAYVCSATARTRKRTRTPSARPGREDFIGVSFGAFLNWGGTFTAMNMTNNKKVWQKRWPEVCYSGSVSTAGGLVFTGRGGTPTFEKGLGRNAIKGGTGLLVGYNGATGEPLFQAKTTLARTRRR